MQKFYIIFILAVYNIFAFYLIGCGENDEDAVFVRANPPNNSTFESGDTIAITVTFDNTPVNLNVEGQGLSIPPLWELDGKTLTISKNTKKGWDDFDYVIIITWSTGRKNLNYAVRSAQPPPKPKVVIDAAFVSATPASGIELAATDSIKITFDNNPGDVTASAGTVSGSGKSRTINGPFPVGALALTIEWTNGEGSHTLNYTVIGADASAPKVTDSRPKNGQEGVDPAKVFKDGIEVIFSEPVTGKLRLIDGGRNVGWTSRADGKIIILTGNAGQELSNETEYEIKGIVKDRAGNEAEVSITFVTRKN